MLVARAVSLAVCPPVRCTLQPPGAVEDVLVQAYWDQVEHLMDDDRLVEAACGEIVAYSRERRAVLIFASGVQHGEHIVRILAPYVLQSEHVEMLRAALLRIEK